MDDLDLGRLARDTMRLQRIGTPLADVVREGVRYAAPRAENGWDHSMATLTDCLRMSLLFDESLRALPVIQGLSVAAENQVRRPLRPRPEPADPVAAYGSIPEAIGAYPMLVDAERADDAEALLRGLIAAGVPPAVLRHTLLTAVTDHFLAYGHSMVFVQKAFDLLDQIGWQEADAVLSPLVPEMVLGTRYDKLPYMRKFLRAWQVAEPDLARLARGTGSGPFDSAGYRRALTDGAPEEALSALVRALESGAPVTAVIDATGRAAAERLARFDIDLDLDDTNEWGWLDVTHTLTYLNALRWAWAADPSPQVLRGCSTRPGSCSGPASSTGGTPARISAGPRRTRPRTPGTCTRRSPAGIRRPPSRWRRASPARGPSWSGRLSGPPPRTIPRRRSWWPTS